MTRIDEDRLTAPAARPQVARGTPNVLRLVLMREVRSRGRSGAFIGTTVVTLLLVVGLIVVPTLLTDDTTTYRVGLVGQGGQPIVETATALANSQTADDIRVEADTFGDVADAEAALEDGDVDVVLVDGEELVAATGGGFGGSDVQELLQRAAANRRVAALVGDEQADEIIGALASNTLDVRVLSGQAADENEARAAVAYGGLILTYFIIFTYAVWTLNGVTEEKSNRVIELLLATARPWQLLTGKVLGISLLGLAQFVLTVAAAVVAIRVTAAMELPAIPADMFATLGLWVVLGFGMYMVLAGVSGALASKSEDAQNAMTPLMLLVVGAFFLSFRVLDDPDGLPAVIGTFIPFAAPFVIPVRAAFHALPLWQHLGAIAVALAAIVLLLRLGGRVYAGGLLQFGGRLKWREAFRSAEL